MLPDLASATQPYSCQICQSRFTRHENLKRHAAIHEQSGPAKTLSCSICDTTFSRSDLRRRHMRRKHPEVEVRQTGRAGRARHDSIWSRGSLPVQQHQDSPNDDFESSSPETLNLGWQQQPAQDFVGHHQDLGRNWPLTPAYRCRSGSTHSSNGLCEVPTHASWHSQDQSSANMLGATAQLLSSCDATITSRVENMGDAYRSPSCPTSRSWQRSSSEVIRGVELFFDKLSSSLPFIHRPTFEIDSMPEHLLLALMSLGYQHDDGPYDEQGTRTADLSLSCYSNALNLLESIDDESLDDVWEALLVVQSLLLLDVCAVLYLCEESSATGFRLHSRMIALARSSGLLQSIPQTTSSSEDLDAVWQDFARAESCKRTMFAMHQVDALFYHFLSIPRLLSHLEVKHDLPCHAQDWTAISSAQWAYRQLKFQASGAPPTYTESIRHLLSGAATLDGNLATIDPYSLTNFAHFVLSSLREISGWSTVTGRVSMDRVEPLKASLHTVERDILAAQESSDICVRATWETAMIELHVWSLSHTGGVVHSSVDKALAHSTELAIARDLIFNAEIIESIRSHVEWFLRYLDATTVPDSEPPWVTLFGYKVFLIIWQCVQQGMIGIMETVRVQDGDIGAAVRWAQVVFARRRRRSCGRIVLRCLDRLSQVS